VATTSSKDAFLRECVKESSGNVLIKVKQKHIALMHMPQMLLKEHIEEGLFFVAGSNPSQLNKTKTSILETELSGC